MRGLFKTIILSFTIIILGALLKKGLENFRGAHNTIAVRGLAEQEVKADHASWIIHYRTPYDKDIKKIQTYFRTSSDKIIVFLKSQGFSNEEIEILPSSVKEDDFRSNENTAGNYMIIGHIKVESPNVDLVEETSKKTLELIEQDVLLQAGDNYKANPCYELNKFDSLRPQLISQSIKSAQKIAESFARDANLKLGKITYADQGSISINGKDGSSYGHEASKNKTLRVLSHFTFAIS